MAREGVMIGAGAKVLGNIASSIKIIFSLKMMSVLSCVVDVCVKLFVVVLQKKNC